MGAAVMPLLKNSLVQNERNGALNRPNILLILVDDLGYGDLTCYGAPDLQTPNIDGLMAAGMRFDHFYANCPVCSPTRASLLTGRFPDLVGVPGVIRTFTRDNFGYLDPKAVLLPQMLKKAGYYTGIVGKWHLGLASPNTPTERGFDYFYGFLGDMMEDYYTHRRAGFNYMRENQEIIDPKGHATDIFTDAAVNYIHKRKKQQHPFFLYLAYNAPHVPVQPPQEWLQKVQRREKGIDEKRAKLVALIEHLDAGIGKVVRALKENDFYDNTLILFTSDNGGQVNVGARNGDLRGTKGNMFEGGIREPMCAVWPGHIPAGSRSEQVALTMDLFATICETAGIRITHEIDGLSILPLFLQQQKTLPKRTLFWVRREGWGVGGRAYYAVRRDHYKLLQNSPFEPMQLYNLQNDPLEQKPLSVDHEMYKKLFSALRDHIIKAGAVPWEKFPVHLKK